MSENSSVVAGRNAVRELLSGERDVDKIMVEKGRHDGVLSAIVALALEKKIPVLTVPRAKLDSFSGGVVNQGVIAFPAEINYSDIDDLFVLAEKRKETPLIVIADGIEDPHNLGALIRNAECAGAHGIIIPKRRNAGLSQTVFKTSAGAAEHIPIVKVPNLSSTLRELKKRGVWVYAAEAGGVDYRKCDYTSPTAVILGSEGNGVSRLLKETCDFVVSIPMRGQVNSLNVSAAAAVILFEISSQRYPCD